MAFRIGLITICLLSFLAVSALGELKLVVNINRHGARSPIYTRTDISSWKHSGQLTGVGMRQLYIMGQELRTRYIDKTAFLPPSYDPNVIYVRSTHLNRTIMSALSLLYGLYPNGTGPTIGDNITAENWNIPFNNSQDLSALGNMSVPNRYQPVPIHLVKASKEYVLRSFDDDICSNLIKTRAETHKSANAAKIMSTFDDLRHNLSEIFNQSYNETDIVAMSQLLDNTMMDYYEGNPIKIEFGSPLWKKAMTFYNISIVYLKYATREMINLFSTRSFEYILSYMDSVIEGKSPVKLVLLSGHDTSIMNLAVALNLTSWECMLDKYISEMNKTDDERFKSDAKCAHGTDLASALRFELHKKEDSTDYEIKVYYEDNLFQINGKDVTDYKEFKKVIQGIAVPNYDQVCFGNQNALDDGGKTTVLTYVFLVILLIFSVVLTVLVVNGCKEMGSLNRKIQAEDYRPFP